MTEILHAFITTLFLLIVAHALADYPLQGDFLARAKNRTAPIPGVPWWQALIAHAVIHAGFVYLLTLLWPCALGELVAHVWIDDAKCRGKLTYNQDQALHLGLKVVWAALAVAVQL